MERKIKLNESYQALLRKVEKDKLIAVSKYSPFADIKYLYDFGHRVFGESRLQDLQAKSALAREHRLNDISWHFIGHLQSKKVKDLFKIEKLTAIHSVDSKKLLDEMKKRESCLEHDIDIFLQINTSGEQEKSGVFTTSDAIELVEHFNKLSFFRIKLAGLMTIGKIRTDNFEKEAKKCFSMLSSCKAEIDGRFGLELKLSMGMSSDFLWALESGSDYVRVGSLIFKEP